jgi:hypothetical protein
MPAQPDHDTLRLRRPDRRTPAQLAALVLRELAPRPPSRDLAPTLADVGLSRADRRLASFRERYPAAAERLADGVLWAVAHGHRQPAGRPTRRPCGWDLARAHTRGHRQPPPRVDQAGRLALGDPCLSCAVALGWTPTPTPRPKPVARTAGRNPGTQPPQRAQQVTGPARWASIAHRLQMTPQEVYQQVGGGSP